MKEPSLFESDSSLQSREPLEDGAMLLRAFATSEASLLIEEVAVKMSGLDAMLAPSTPLVAPPQGDGEVTIRGMARDTRTALLTCVLPPSQLACPVISAPIGRHQGLPYGLQIIGRPFSETLLLRVAMACEQRWRWIPAPA